MGKAEDQILQLLIDSGHMTLMEIAKNLEKKPKAVFKSLRKLFEEDKICTEPGTRRYMAVT